MTARYRDIIEDLFCDICDHEPATIGRGLKTDGVTECLTIECVGCGRLKVIDL